MSILTGHDLLEIALQMERNGEAFYTRAAGKVTDAHAKELLLGLAREEADHLRRFDAMLRDLVSEPVAESWQGEYQSYLRAHVDSQVFTSERMEKLLSQPTLTPREALAFAIDSEKDAILYYSEMKRMLPPRTQAVVDPIIEEERRHLAQLVAG